MIKFQNEISDRNMIEIAKDKLCLDFLQFVWESTSQETISSPSNNLNKLKEAMIERKLGDTKVSKKRKSILINNINNLTFNKGVHLFKVCDIISFLVILKKNILIK